MATQDLVLVRAQWYYLSTKLVLKRFDNTKNQTKAKIDNEAYKKFIWEEPRQKFLYKEKNHGRGNILTILVGFDI